MGFIPWRQGLDQIRRAVDTISLMKYGWDGGPTPRGFSPFNIPPKGIWHCHLALSLCNITEMGLWTWFLENSGSAIFPSQGTNQTARTSLRPIPHWKGNKARLTPSPSPFCSCHWNLSDCEKTSPWHPRSPLWPIDPQMCSICRQCSLLCYIPPYLNP